MKFINGTNCEASIRQLIADAERVRIAVAYWGAGATEQLHLQSLANSNVTVVCDLMSGACNPQEIRKLQKALGSRSVLTRDRLHAKVWLTERGAIVGSSNASANGLGFEGAELSGSLEANVLIDDASTLRDVEAWFETEVLSGEAREIREEDFLEAQKRWDRRRAGRPFAFSGQPGKQDLIQAIKAHPERFAADQLTVWIYSHVINEGAWEKIKEERTNRNIPLLDCWDLETKDVRAPGSYVLDFESSDNGAKFLGLWRVLSDSPAIPKMEGGRKVGVLLLCIPASTFELAGLSLPVGDPQQWNAAAARAIRSDATRTEWTIADFRRFL